MKTQFPFPALAATATCLMLQVVSAVALPADVLFSEDFENPDVPSYSQGITPDIWVRAAQGYGSGDHGMTDKSGGDFSAPSGNEQAYAFRYSNSGITTKEKALGSPLIFGGGYEVSFDVVKDNNTGGTGYNVKLIAFGAGAARDDCRSTPTGSTVLASTTGSALSNGTISTVSFTFIPNATTHAAEFGKDLGIRVIGGVNAIIDNIKFRAIPGTSSGLNLVTTNPLDNSANNLASSPVKAIFNKNITVGSGNITLRNLTDVTDTVIPVGDPRIAINGSCLDILPGPHLTWAKDYAVLIDAGAVVESPGGTPCVAITDPTVWNFTTAGGDPLLYSISQLKSHIIGTITLTAAEIDTIKRNLDSVAGRFAESSTTITALLDLVSTYDTATNTSRKGPLWVYRSLPRRDVVTNDLHWTMFNVMQNIMDRIYTGPTLAAHESLLNGFKFASSSNFPGACAAPAPNTYTATISASYLKTYGPAIIADGPGTYARKPTGTYLSPGTIATVTVPASMVGTGYKIRVGCHSPDFSAKPDIKRLDRVTRVYEITSLQTKVANPLGGGIYIEVPWLANAGVVNVDITDAVRSPYFSAKSFHSTTASQWDTVERSNPAPWADFQTDKFMMQVPKSWIYSMTGAQAIQLMTDWDAAMDAITDLMGYTAFNPATGPAKYIRGKETMYPQVDLLLKNSVYAPGYPSINTTYSPTGSYGGYATSHLVRGPQNAPDYEFHEQGHGYLFPKFAGETESAVNLLHVAVWNRKFGVSMDEAFRKSRGYTRTYMTLDTTAMAWMCVFNFSPRKVPMADGEKAYQLKGHAKFVDIANLYGWDVLGKFWGTMVDYEEHNTAYATDTDTMLLRLCKSVGKDIRPLFHFWGIYPQNPSALAAAIAAENIPADPAIRTRLLHYKDLVPADNAAFRTFALGWWGKQPSINGYWEEREHARQWDTAPLYGVGDQQRTDATNPGEIYNEYSANDIRNRIQELVDLYFPGAISPNTMAFSIAPGALNATTIGMTAVTATAGTGPVQYYFENTTNSTNSGWIASSTWSQSALTTGTPYSFRVKARDGLGFETLWSDTASATPATDVTPPSPSPMNFSTPPTALSETSVTMTAGTATDVSGVEYFFDCTTPGGHASGWQDSPSYTDTLLNPSTQYTYQVQARDKSPAQNATAVSATASATTPTPDTTPPALVSFNPADNATDVPLANNLVITFNELIGPNLGFITIKNLTDSTETVIDITDDTQITISGPDVSINPTTSLIPGKNYAIRIDPGALQDLASNPFTGITDDTTWNFTTAVIPYVWTQAAGNAQDWATGTNWLAAISPIPIAGDTVDFSSTNIAANTTLTLSADRTAQLWKFGDTSGTQTWTVNAGNKMILDGTTPTIQVNNNTATLNNAVDGTAGLTKTGAGTLALAGTNTYTGGTTISAGILSVTSSAATAVAGGPLTLSGGGRLTVSSTNISSTSQVSIGSGGGLISVTGNNNFTTTGKLTGSGTLTHADPGGAGGRSLNFNSTTNDLTGGIIINGGNSLTFSVNSLADSSNNIAFTAASGTIGFTYGSGATSPLALASRAFEINSAGALNSTILNNNTTQGITVGPNLVATGAGAKTLTLNAVAGPANVFSGNISNGADAGTVAITRSGAGAWALGGTNTYSGATQISASATTGKLVIQGKQALSPNTTVTLFQNSSSHGDLWLLDDTAGTVSLPNTLTIDHKNSVLNLVVFVGNNGAANGGSSPSATTTATTIAFNKLNFTDLNNGQGLVGFNASGANSYRLQFNQVDLPAFTTTLTSLATWTARLVPGSANITLAGTVRQLAGNTCTFGTQPVFGLDGTSANNLVSADIKDPTDLGANALAKALQVTKTNSSTWTLSGTNTFSGGLTLSGATAGSQLNLNSASALGTGALTINGGNNAKIDNTSGSAITLSTNNAQTWSSDFAFVGSNELNLGTGAVTMGGSRNLTVTANALTVGGAISGSAFNLTKLGNGTLNLTGNNAYTGTTTVSAGKLFINGDQTAASGAVSVSANATLGGTGIIGGATTLVANGKLAFNLSTAPGSHDKLELAAAKSLTFSGASTLTITSSIGATTGDYTLLTAPGGITGSVPATLVLPPDWAATLTKENSNTDLVLHVTSTGVAGPGPVDHFVISAITGTKIVGTPITGITLTAQDATNQTATGFTGTVTFGGSGGFGGTSASFTAGVLSGVSATPTVAGSNLTLTVNDGSGHAGSATIATIQTPYDSWSGGAAFDADTNGDGVKNGLAWLLGATGPNASALLPTVTQSSGNLVLTFTCLNAASRGGATLHLEQSSNIGISDPWVAAVVPESTGGEVNGVSFTVTPGSPSNRVVATVSASEAASGKLFSRLKAVPAQ